MKRMVASFFILGVFLLFTWSVHAAADADKGKMLAKSCTCHKGDLDGMKPEKFVKTMQEFKDGSLENRIMNRIAKKYNSQDFQDLSAWFASQ